MVSAQGFVRGVGVGSCARKMDLDELLLGGNVVPLQDLLSWGPDLWEDDGGEDFVPNVEEAEDEEGDRRDAEEEDEDERREHKRSKTKKREAEVGAEVDDAYRRLLENKNLPLEDEADDDSYDFLADVDVNVEQLKEDREDELEVGAADRDEVEFLAGEGGASFVDVAKGSAAARRKKAKKQTQKLLSSPAKGTRSAAASYRFKHPVLTMNVPDAAVSVNAETEPNAAQMARIQEQLNLLQQLVLQGIGLATAARNSDLVSLYQSICLEMEVQYTGTPLTLPLLDRASNLTHLTDIAKASPAK